ncbi:hypothetical protein [Streptomyces sp. UG1]|uniref:hypothetical protein n=1 Tax=Streptomyces sp. UG1 TaxID=3417652 RepID=UPI003CEAB4BF
MAQDSWPSPNHNSRNVTDAEYEQLAARFSDDGVWGTPADSSVVYTTSGLQVLVRAAKFASLRGHAWTSGTTDDALTIASNASGQTRTDRVVLRLERSTWDVRAVVKQGTPGSGAPALTQDTGSTGVFEIQLARVTVPDSATSVTVTREELYVGSRVRAVDSATPNLFPQLGEIQFERDTGRWRGWDGSQRRTLFEDTGLLFISPGFSTWDQVFHNVGRRIGDQVWLRVWVQRQESALSVNDPDGSKIGVLPSALRSVYNNFYVGKFYGSGVEALVEVRTDGEIWVTRNDGTVPIGNRLALTMSYLRV